MTAQETPSRYQLLDTLRGLCLLNMVAYHGMYDLVDIFGLPSSWYWGLPGYLWQQSICWTFILLSGMCWQLSRHHLKRGLILVGCGAAITLVTLVVMPSQRILYGVLNLLGLCALLIDVYKRQDQHPAGLHLHQYVPQAVDGHGPQLQPAAG